MALSGPDAKVFDATLRTIYSRALLLRRSDCSYPCPKVGILEKGLAENTVDTTSAIVTYAVCWHDPVFMHLFARASLLSFRRT